MIPQIKYIHSKKGFTLVEVIVVVSMITILFGYNFMSLRNFSKNTNDMDCNIFANSLMNFVVCSKEYCRDNNQSGYLYFHTDKNKIIFISNSSTVSSLYLPEGFGDLRLNLIQNKVFIDNKGFTSDACTINFKDREGGNHCATICVGSSYVDIKN
ncbi:MAG: type II secretion system protein [Solirubrobacterales bacterium]